MTDAKVVATASYLEKIFADRISADEKFTQFQAKCLELSYQFHGKVIPNLVYDEVWETKLEGAPGYRVCGIADHPLNPSGSLGSGARMNMGFAQSSTGYREDFRPLANVQGAIYVADSVRGAILETYGDEYPLERSLHLLRAACSCIRSIFWRRRRIL